MADLLSLRFSYRFEDFSNAKLRKIVVKTKIFPKKLLTYTKNNYFCLKIQRNFMKRSVLSLLDLFVSLAVCAQSFTINGIRYKVVSSNTVKTDLSYDTGIDNYDIPPTVEYDGQTYAVSCIGSYLTSRTAKSVSIPQTIQVIETKAFARTESLSEVRIADIASWVSIDFVGEDNNPLSNKNYTNLSVYIDGKETRDIAIPDGVEEIKANSFYKCYWLSSITLPSTLKKIGGNAFYRCWGLTSLELPENITEIGEGAFYECNGLNSIIVKSVVPALFNGSYQFDDATYKRAILYVPKGTTDLYRMTPGWSNFANIEEIDPTGIQSVEIERNNNGDMYSIDGVKIECPESGMIIIQNGKKRIAK